MKALRPPLLAVATLCAALLPNLAPAQPAWPSAKPITLIVPFPPGGVADITGRPTAHVMGKLLKQSVVVQNKGGAGGTIGVTELRPGLVGARVPGAVGADGGADCEPAGRDPPGWESAIRFFLFAAIMAAGIFGAPLLVLGVCVKASLARPR